MRILYFSWYENCKDDTRAGFADLGISVTLVAAAVADYWHAPEVEEQIRICLEQSPHDAIFTYDYFPFLSVLAKEYQIPYISWIYDCPHYTLYAREVLLECNHIFVFDQMLRAQLEELGAKHVYHMPLAVNGKRLKQLTGEQSWDDRPKISFVGSLYEQCMYDQINYLPDELRGFLDALFACQQRLWGHDFFAELLTPGKVKELEKYIKLPKDDRLMFPTQRMFVDMLDEKMTSIDRIGAMQLLGTCFQVDLYSNSGLQFDGGVRCRGTVNYHTQMPLVFHDSSVNLNLTLRSIVSGIPLRALDIMGAGGFLLSNAQPELIEYFEPGEEIAVFYSPEEMVEQCAYYLDHEQERKRICEAGHEKVCRDFSYEKQLGRILELTRSTV